MNFKNNLKSKKAQSTVEYFLMLIVLTAGILFVFHAFNTNDLSVTSMIDQAVGRAITRIAR